MANKINNKDLSYFGASILASSYASLLTPSPLKAFVENADRSQPGTQVLVTNPQIDERDVTITFLIKGEDQADFLSKYNSCIAELYKGSFLLYIDDLSTTYHLLYSNVTQYDNYVLTACKLAVKFREPNPANRT